MSCTMIDDPRRSSWCRQNLRTILSTCHISTTNLHDLCNDGLPSKCYSRENIDSISDANGDRFICAAEDRNAHNGLHHFTSMSIPGQLPHQSSIRPGLVLMYLLVDTIIEKKEDSPGPRCGYTFNVVAAVGEEGSPGYIVPRLILFSGVTAFGNNVTASKALNSPGSSNIRLAGATADVHCYDISSNKWSRITPLGEPPTPGAAHVAAAVGTMVVFQGGIGPAGLSSEDLHALDLTQQRPR